MIRAIYFAVFVVLAVAAAAVYYYDNRETTVLVAKGDLAVGSTISDGSVTVRRARVAAIPAGTAGQVTDVRGMYVASPILDGQYLPMKALAHDRAGLIEGGLQVPSGFRALAVPVAAADAAGGALRPGDYADVLAVPKNQASGASPAAAVTLGRHVLVLGLRTDQGQPLEAPGGAARGLNFSGSRIASVVLAVASVDEAIYAAAEPVSTFTVVLDLG